MRLRRKKPSGTEGFFMVGLAGADAKEWQPILAHRAAHPPKAAMDTAEAPKGPETSGHGAAAPKSQVHLPLNRQLEVVALYKEGIAVKEIAARFNIHRRTVSVICERHGVELRNKTRGLTDEQLQIAIRRYEEGASLATVGAELGINATTVRKHLLATGVQMRSLRGAHPERLRMGHSTGVAATPGNNAALATPALQIRHHADGSNRA